MPKGYVIFTEAIDDEAGMEAYARASGPTLPEAGAKVLALDPSPDVLEGAWHGSRTVVLEFPSVQAARAWYESESYQKAKPLRQAAAHTNAVIISGFDPRAARPSRDGDEDEDGHGRGGHGHGAHDRS